MKIIKNFLLDDKSYCELNMLWAEKSWFVNECLERKYFETYFYGWCDIQYFRNRPQDLNTTFLSTWSSKDKILLLDRKKISYAYINNDNGYLNYLHKIINNKNSQGLPVQPIPPFQNSVAGGFFISYKDKVKWRGKTFDDKLHLYFKNNYLVKDDQIILIDCILSDLNNFSLFRDNSI